MADDVLLSIIFIFISSASSRTSEASPFSLDVHGHVTCETV